MREAFEGLYWILENNFNVPLMPSKKKGGVKGFYEGMIEFANFVRCNNLMDLDLKRFRFTWTNGRGGDANIQACWIGSSCPKTM